MGFQEQAARKSDYRCELSTRKGGRRFIMKAAIAGVCFLVAVVQAASAQPGPQPLSTRPPSEAEQEIIRLSREKWVWMAERRLDALQSLFHEDAVFVHMGGNMTTKQELEVIRTGKIHYKQADIQDVSARIFGSTAIVLSRIRLLAVVGGREVTNPFMVTEVYLKQDGAWKLVQLSFSRLLGQ